MEGLANILGNSLNVRIVPAGESINLLEHELYFKEDSDAFHDRISCSKIGNAFLKDTNENLNKITTKCEKSTKKTRVN